MAISTDETIEEIIEEVIEEDAAAAPPVVEIVEEEAEEAVLSTDAFNNLQYGLQLQSIMDRQDNNADEHAAADAELKNIKESLQDSLAETRYISSKMDAVSNDTDGIIKQVNSILINNEMLKAEIEANFSSTNSKSSYYKTLLTISSVVLALMVIFQVYIVIALHNIQELQDSASSSLKVTISNLNKKMVEYDKNLVKTLVKPAQQDHGQQNPAAVETTDNETRRNKEISSSNATTVLEKLNKLRNGLPEKKLIRKETGDWFIYNKKNNESISDAEVIQALNGAYKKIGRLSTIIPLPPINALCILQPDGKGGTQIFMTKEFVP